MRSYWQHKQIIEFGPQTWLRLNFGYMLKCPGLAFGITLDLINGVVLCLAFTLGPVFFSADLWLRES